MNKTILVVLSFFFLLLVTPQQVLAHRDGCHRWHSCPSDNGSYVCGDLGYKSGCPNVQAPVLPTNTPYPTIRPTKISKPTPTKKPPVKKAIKKTATKKTL